MADGTTYERDGAKLSAARGSAIPPRQRPYEQALHLGFAALLSAAPSADKLEALGAALESGGIRLPVLNRWLRIDLQRRKVFVEGQGQARDSWALLVVHYLCAEDITPDAREVSFSHFAESRGYLKVFNGRIIGRFLATSGRTPQQFAQLSERLGGVRLPGSGLGYRFSLLPRVPMVIVRHEGDDEVGPGATFIYRADAERLLPAEDRVVAAELLLDALAGKPMAEKGGTHETGR